jgi:hypothetical protein
MKMSGIFIRHQLSGVIFFSFQLSSVPTGLNVFSPNPAIGHPSSAIPPPQSYSASIPFIVSSNSFLKSS